MLSLVGGDITALAHTEEAKLICSALHEAGVFYRIMTHLMVEMCDDELAVEVVPQPIETVKHGHGIGPSGDGNEEGLTTSKHVEVLEGPPYLLEEGIHNLRCLT
jgi:hypothetical protein